MYDIKPLEAEWKRYNKKKRRPWYIGLFLVLATSIGLFLAPQYKMLDFSLKKFTFNTEKTQVVVPHSFLLHSPLHRLSQKNEGRTDPLVKEQESSSEVVENLPLEKPTKEKNIHKKRVHLNIIETSSVNAYEDVAKRFHKLHDSDDSLFLAKTYYKKGLYKKAEYWALQTNKINTNIEESWLIFAKVKMKRKHKNEAIRILKTYIKRSNSIEAKKLLYKIKKGSL